MPSPITALTLITDAFLDSAIHSAGEPLSAEDSAFGLSKLSRLLDAWSVEDLNVFAVDFLQYVLVPNTQPLLIGQAAVITQASLTTNVVTYLAVNSYKAGDFVDVSGCVTGTFNVTRSLVLNATAKQFQISLTHADILPETETVALGVYTGSTPPNYATLTQRPAKIENANIILNNVNPIVKVPLQVHNNKPGADWWAANSVPTVPTTLPTDLYYSAQWPNGFLYLWPLQNMGYGLELEVWVNLADIPTLNYPFYLPQGYRDAVTWSLAEELCPSYEKQPNPLLGQKAMKARALIKGLNSFSPLIVTRDSGIPRGSHNRSYFNWLNGTTTAGKSG